MLSSGDLDKLRVVCYPDPVLREHCQPVSDFGPALEALTARMLELMHAGKGVGLAAPQVGLALRLFVCNHAQDPEDDQVYVNPVLSDLVGGVTADEGCLSLPEVTVPVRRAESVSITACDPQGKELRATAGGLQARVWQHETDHLDGRMIIDSMPTSAELVNRRILKDLKDKYAAQKKKRVSRR